MLLKVFLFTLISLLILQPKIIMGFIKDINELPLWLKAIILSIFIIMPIWFIILSLYFPIIKSYKWYIILMYAFVPSIIWYLLHLISGYILFKDELETNYKKVEKYFFGSVTIDTIIYLIVIAGLLITINVRFITFLIIIFIYKISTLFFIKIIKKLSQKG